MPITGEVLAAGFGLDVKQLATIGGIATLGIGAKILRPYIRIEPDEEAVRTRGGNLTYHKRGGAKGQVKHLGPGPHLVVPFSHEIRRQKTSAQTTPLGAVSVERGGAIVYDAEATVIWRVMSSGVSRNTMRQWFAPWKKPWQSTQTDDYPYRSMFAVDDLEKTVKSLCSDALTTAMEEAEADEFRDSRIMTEAVVESCGDELKTWGTEVLRIAFDQRGMVSDVDRLGRWLAGSGSTDPREAAAIASQFLGGGRHLAAVPDPDETGQSS